MRAIWATQKTDAEHSAQDSLISWHFKSLIVFLGKFSFYRIYCSFKFGEVHNPTGIVFCHRVHHNLCEPVTCAKTIKFTMGPFLNTNTNTEKVRSATLQKKKISKTKPAHFLWPGCDPQGNLFCFFLLINTQNLETSGKSFRFFLK